MSFIGIKTPNGDWLDLSNNTKLDFALETPVGKFDTVYADRLYNFKLPATPHNNKALGYPKQINNRNVFSNLYEGYELHMGGLLYAKGIITITKVYPTYIDLAFSFGTARLAPYKDYKLTQINLGIYTFPALSGAPINTYMNTVAASTIDDYDFTFAPITQDTGGAVTINFYDRVASAFSISIIPQLYITPFFYVVSILNNLSTITGLSHTGDFVTDNEIRTLCFYSPIVVDSTTVEAGRFLPDISVADLYKELTKLFCLALFFSREGDFVEIKSIKNILADSRYVDYTNAAPIDFESEFLKDAGITLIQENDTNDAQVLQQQYSYNYGNVPRTEITSQFSYPKTVQDSNVRQTQVNQDYLYDAATEDRPAFTPRLFFYRGFQPDSSAQTYPFVAFDDQKFGPTEIAGTNYILSWQGTKGLYNVWWKNYADFITNTRIVTVKASLNLEQIKNFDFARKIKIGPYFFLPKTLKFSADKSGLSVAELTLYRL